MTSKRSSIRLNPHESALIRVLYLEKRLAVDAYDKLPNELAILTEVWNRRSGRSDLPRELLHYMRNERKGSRWVTLDGNHRRVSTEIPAIDSESTIQLVEVYCELFLPRGIGTDSIGNNDELCDELSRAFARRTRKRLSGGELVFALTTLRKAGVLPTISAKKDIRKSSGIGFGDIDRAVG